jgi:hypothetical protein
MAIASATRVECNEEGDGFGSKSNCNKGCGQAMAIRAMACHAHGNNLSGQWRISTIIWYFKTIEVPVFKSI